LKKRRKAADDAFEQQMSKLEQQVGSINQQVEAMTVHMQWVIVQTLTADNRIISQQHTIILDQDKKLNRMETVVGQLTTSIQDLISRDRARDATLTETVVPGSTPVSTPPQKKNRSSEIDHTPDPDSTMTPLPPPVPDACRQ
jgi:hypothetical protein